MGSNSRVGLFGGTFDPVHFGHLRSAVEIAEIYTLSSLYLMPNHQPGHRGPTGASTDHRVEMLTMAIVGASRLVVDARETRRKEPTFTIDTLKEIHSEQPKATLLFFLGMDSFAAFDSWHQWEEILRFTNLVVLNRPGVEHSKFSRQLLDKQQAACGSKIVNGRTGVIQTCQITQLAVSATDVRRRIANDLSVRFLLPDDVSEYIDANKLYRS